MWKLASSGILTTQDRAVQLEIATGQKFTEKDNIHDIISHGIWMNRCLGEYLLASEGTHFMHKSVRRLKLYVPEFACVHACMRALFCSLSFLINIH